MQARQIITTVVDSRDGGREGVFRAERDGANRFNGDLLLSAEADKARFRTFLSRRHIFLLYTFDPERGERKLADSIDMNIRNR